MNKVLRELSKSKPVLGALIILVIGGSYLLLSGGSEEGQDYVAGDRSALVPQDSDGINDFVNNTPKSSASHSEGKTKAVASTASNKSTLPKQSEYSDAPPRVKVPDFNYITALASQIDNVRNKPESLLSYQYDVAEEVVNRRTKLKEALANETKADNALVAARNQSKDLSPGISSKSSDSVSPNSDINPLAASKLIDVSYSTSDFRITFMPDSHDSALMEYRGKVFEALVGKEILPKVNVVKITSEGVQLSVPHIGKFLVPRTI